MVARSALGLLIPFPHYIPPGRPLGRGRPAWPTRLADPKSGCERHEGEHVAVLGRGRGHNGRVEGHVRRRLDVKAVDARTDGRELTRSPAVVPPIMDRNRDVVSRFQGTKSDARHYIGRRRPSARFQPARVPFRSASSLPVAPLPSLRPSRSRRAFASVCSAESRLFRFGNLQRFLKLEPEI